MEINSHVPCLSIRWLEPSCNELDPIDATVVIPINYELKCYNTILIRSYSPSEGQGMNKVIALIAAIILLVSIFFVAASPAIFIDFWCFVLTAGFTMIAIIGRHGWEGFRCLSVAKERNPVLKTICIASIFSGFIGVLIGSITILSNLSNPEMIGPAVAVAIISMLYGVFQGYLAYILIDESR